MSETKALTNEVSMVFNSNDNSFSKSEASFSISREGLSNLKKRRFNNNMSMMSVNRVRKTEEQVRILTDLFERHDGKVTRKLRKEAERKTGLAWIQIYKWVFDKKARKSQVDNVRLFNYPIPIFRVINKYGRDLTKPRPIFKLERVARQAERTSGKPEIC